MSKVEESSGRRSRAPRGQAERVQSMVGQPGIDTNVRDCQRAVRTREYIEKLGGEMVGTRC